MKIIWFFFSLCLLVGCKRSDVAVSVEQTLPVIDLNVAYPEKKLDLAEVASPEYIPLYTVGADSLDRYSLTSASVSPHWVVAYNWQQTIMVFERATGKLRYRFNHQGQQKEQYYYIFSVFVDEEREEIYVVGSVFKIQVYSLSGNYKRTLNLPYDMSFEQVFDYDKDSLIFNDGREDVDNPVQKGTYYYLMSKTDGGMRPLPFHVKYRITNRFRIRLRNGDRQGVISCMFSVKPLLKNGDEVIEKVYRRNIKKLDGDSFVYDYREKEIFTPVLVNSDFIPELPVEIDNMNGSFPKYAGASSIHSREFMQYYRKGNLQGRACEAASCLTRDDIYVLVLYHFN